MNLAIIIGGILFLIVTVAFLWLLVAGADTRRRKNAEEHNEDKCSKEEQKE